MILLSRSDLPNAYNPTVQAGENNSVVFSWVNNDGTGKTLSTDLCLVAAYCPAQRLSICNSLNTAPTRNTGELELPLAQFTGLEVETYISFFSADGKEISDSFYTGQILVP